MLSLPAIKSMVIALVTATIMAASPSLAKASPLDDARSAGYVGERPDGYVGVVDPNAPADVKALVDKVNTQRRTKYEALAAEQSVPVEQVGAVTAEKIIGELLQPGWYYMDASGNWVQK